MTEHRVRIDRSALTITELEKKYTPPGNNDEKNGRIRNWAPFKECSSGCLLNKFLNLFPFINMFRNYKIKRNLVGDIGAGICLSVVHIPQSLGFALLSGLPPEYGLYSSFFQPLFYFFFSTSRHTSMGAMAVISLMIGAAVQRELGTSASNAKVTQEVLSNTTDQTTLPVLPTSTDSYFFDDNVTLATVLGDGMSDSTRKAVGLATCMAFLAGLMQVAMSVLRLGWMTTFMPPSFVGGFTTACAFYIFSTQIIALLGITVHQYVGIFRFCFTMVAVGGEIPNTHPATVVTSLICLAVLLFIKEFINIKFSSKIKFPIPADFLIVVIGIIASYYMQFRDKWGVAVVGKVARGFPTPQIPPLEYAPSVITDALIAAIVCFVISFSLASVCTTKYGYNIDTNQELLAYGLTHFGSSFFNCFLGSSAPPRVFIYEAAGGKTGLAHLISSGILLIVIMVVGPLFTHLPKCVLASVITVAIVPLYKQFSDLKIYWRICKLDFCIWIFTFLVVILTDIAIGLGISLIFVLVAAVIQFLWSKGYVMGVLRSQDLTGNLDQFSTNTTWISGVKIFRFDATLFYITVPRFKSELFSKICNPRADMTEHTKTLSEVSDDDDSEPKQNVAKDINGDTLDAIIVDCSAFNFVDIMGINCLRSLYQDFKAINVKLILCQCSPGFIKRLNTSGLLNTDDFLIYPTIQDALGQYWKGSITSITNSANGE